MGGTPDLRTRPWTPVSRADYSPLGRLRRASGGVGWAWGELLKAGPKRFGQFEVDQRLAVGGMGEIFLAHQTVLGVSRRAIVKTLIPDTRDSDEQVQRTEAFEKEARIAATLNHPNIVQLFEVGEQEGTPYIAMEFVG